MDGGIRRVAPTLALAVFGGAAPANLRITSAFRPILSTANSCASGAVALGEALGAVSKRRGGRRRLRRRSSARSRHSRSGRSTSSGRWPTPTATTRTRPAVRSTRLAAASSSAEGGLLVLEEAEAARRRGAVPYAELLRSDASSDAYHMVQPDRTGATPPARSRTPRPMPVTRPSPSTT